MRLKVLQLYISYYNCNKQTVIFFCSIVSYATGNGTTSLLTPVTIVRRNNEKPDEHQPLPMIPYEFESAEGASVIILVLILSLDLALLNAVYRECCAK